MKPAYRTSKTFQTGVTRRTQSADRTEERTAQMGHVRHVGQSVQEHLY